MVFPFDRNVASAAAVCLLAAACQTPPIAQTTPPDQRFNDVRAQVSALVNDKELKSVAVGFIEDGRVIWAEAFGYADEESGERAATTTPYGIASMGKAITATAAMTLVERGDLDLDATVVDILGPDAIVVRAGSRAPTVRELLNMTSGVPHGALTYIGAEPLPEETVLDRQSFVAFPAGSTLHYSNFSMALMERVIEKASGMGYDDYVARAVFHPLRMADARIGANASGTAARYGVDGARLAPLTPYPRSSRQMSASVADLLKFAAMHLGAKNGSLSVQSVLAMQHEKSLAPGAHMALGIGNFDFGDGASLIASSGNDMGVQSSMFLLPESGFGAIVLSNSSGYHSDEIAVAMLDAAAPGSLDRFIKVADSFQSRTQPFAPSAAWIGDWRGSVAGPDGAIPVAMTITSGGIAFSIDEAEAATVEEAAFRDGMFTGAFTGRLDLYEAPDGSHRIEISLIENDGRLVGFALANFRSARGKFEIPAALTLKRAD